MHAQGRPFDGLAGATCVVTGGLGFVGSNAVIALLSAGARVRVVDALVPEHGGRADQLEGHDVERVLVATIDDARVAELLEGADVVLNVAGQVSHTASMRDPQRDLWLNATSHAALLEHVRRVAPGCRIVHTSTRQVYGRPATEVVDESHPAAPVDVNGVAKWAGEQLHLVYARAHGLRATCLRLTNVYGPRQRLTSDELGFLPVFLRRALRGEEILIFGDGAQRRDCLHVDDVVAAVAAVVSCEATVGEVYNVGHTRTYALSDIAALVVDAAASAGGVRLVPFPAEQARIDIGSFHTGAGRLTAAVGWRPRIDLADGVADTVAFYREHPWYLSST